MANVNVNRSLTDQFYRYKMPRIIAKVEGKGNGIKTVIVNMTDVAKALNRPPTYATKYFGCELGAQTQCDTKNDRFIVNGAHEAAKLQDILDGFIRRYVLCQSCDNPETVLGVLPRKGVISSKCKACGYAGTIDPSHKLNTFILRNPPGAQDAGTASASVGTTPSKTGIVSTKKLKKGKNDGGAANGNESPHDSDEGKGDSGNGKDENGDEEEGNEDDDDWGEETSEEAMKRRMQDLSMSAKGLMLNDDLEKTEQERIDILYAFVKSKLPLDAANYKEVVGEAERLEVKDKAVLVLCELLLDANAVAQLKQHRLLFLRLTHENKKAQRYLLGAIEQVVKLHKDALLPRVPHLLKTLYDEDIVDEEFILDWAKRVSKKYVGKDLAAEIHEKAAPFIKWLQEAEVEESTDSEEENVEVVYSDRHHSGRIQELKEESTTKKKPEMNGHSTAQTAAAQQEDEIDIDAI